MVIVSEEKFFNALLVFVPEFVAQIIYTVIDQLATQKIP